VQVWKPQGSFVQQLIKVAPAGGDGWREVEDAQHHFKLTVPAGATLDIHPNGSRVLQAVLTDQPSRPRPVLRVDVFRAGKDDPEDVDVEYLAKLLQAYPEQTFGGRFAVTDSGLVVLKKTNLAMIGGVGVNGAVRTYRMQWSQLGPDQQVFLTFDCAETEWEKYSETVARILLSFEPPHPKRG
jgi:hypothetical protein